MHHTAGSPFRVCAHHTAPARAKTAVHYPLEDRTPDRDADHSVEGPLTRLQAACMQSGIWGPTDARVRPDACDVLI